MAYPYDEEDRRAALTQGLLAAGLAALGARKGSEFNALGQAGLLGLTGYNAALRTATDARESQALRKMREQQWQQQQAEYLRAQQERAGMQGAHAAAITPAVPGGEAEPREGGMTPGLPGGFDDAKYIQALRTNPNIDPTKALAYQQLLAKPQKELKEIITATVGGEERQVAFYKDGTREVLPYGAKAGEQWEDIPTPKGAAPGPQWQRSKTTGQLRSVGSQPPVTNINLGAPKFEGGDIRGFVYPPSAENPTGKVVQPEGMPAKANKPPVEYQKQLTGMTNLNTAVQEYVDGLKDWNVTSIVSPGAVAQMGTKYNNMMLQAKEAYNLGVLNGPDYMILQQVVTNPATLKGTITSNDALANQAVELARIMKRNAANLAKVHGQPAPDIGPVGEPGPSNPRESGGAVKGTAPAATGRTYQSATMPKLDDLPNGSEVVDSKTGITLIKRNGKWEKK